jgi:single-strand DNA-binding protein
MAELGVFGVGVATADPELRSVGQNNMAVCTVNLAFNRSYQDKDKKWQQEPCFLRAQAWGARAKRMAELVRKGQPIYVCGYMKQDSWEKDGQKRVAFSITLRDFQLCEKNGKKKCEPQPAGDTTSPAELPIGGDDDIPF